MRSGCAYRSPSSMGDAQSFFAARGDAGPSDAIPVRALSPKYVVQCGPRADPSAVEVVPAVERVVTVNPPADPELVDDERGVSEPDEHAANPHNANTTIQRRIPREGRILREGSGARGGTADGAHGASPLTPRPTSGNQARQRNDATLAHRRFGGEAALDHFLLVGVGGDE